MNNAEAVEVLRDILKSASADDQLYDAEALRHAIAVLSQDAVAWEYRYGDRTRKNPARGPHYWSDWLKGKGDLEDSRRVHDFHGVPFESRALILGETNCATIVRDYISEMEERLAYAEQQLLTAQQYIESYVSQNSGGIL